MKLPALLLLIVITWCHCDTQSDMDSYRRQVKEMFQHAYDNYLLHAFPHDELAPISCVGVDTWGSFSLTLLDALDTLVVMGNQSEFRRAYQLALQQHLSFNIDTNTSVFEANIRVVGGLLSAHLLSARGGIPVPPGWPCEGPLLSMAESLARRLLPAFDTPTGLPYGSVNLRYGVSPGETPLTCTSCCASYIVEFGVLSRLTGDTVFEDVALRAIHALWNRRSTIGLVGNHINVLTGEWKATDFTVGNFVDSYLEYLVKGGILLRRPELLEMFHDLYQQASRYSKLHDWFVSVNMNTGQISSPYYYALDAYWPGLLSMVGELPQAEKSFIKPYSIWRSLGVLPEMFNIADGKPVAKHEAYHLRPELAESTWYLFRATKNPFYLEVGKAMIHSIQNISRVNCGYATVKNSLTHVLADRMESYFLAETTKYLYLLFDPDNFLNQQDAITHKHVEHLHYDARMLRSGCTVGSTGYILTTEAHPIDTGIIHCCGMKNKPTQVNTCNKRPFSSRLQLSLT
ncbi:ER degradation-enhancing alpha-mannosidase-like protein 2 [Dysidea avara]|uniref:ER degradation-enhancing alpha-mannosidase-like protein 2 n=1 Tax=Dysidea avara TaxID=196820 RepID=UPI0033289B32